MQGIQRIRQVTFPGLCQRIYGILITLKPFHKFCIHTVLYPPSAKNSGNHPDSPGLWYIGFLYFLFLPAAHRMPIPRSRQYRYHFSPLRYIARDPNNTTSCTLYRLQSSTTLLINCSTRLSYLRLFMRHPAFCCKAACYWGMLINLICYLRVPVFVSEQFLLKTFLNVIFSL